MCQSCWWKGGEITTIEGLGTSTPGAAAGGVIVLQAAQCGYCIPGMMMSAHALLRATRSRAKRTSARRCDQSLSLRHPYADSSGDPARRAN